MAIELPGEIALSFKRAVDFLVSGEEEREKKKES